MEKYALERVEFLQSALEEIGADAILVTSEISHRYLTDFNNSDGALFITKENKYAFEDSRYFEEVSKRIGDQFIVFESALNIEKVNEIIKKEGIKTVAFEKSSIKYSLYKILEQRLEAPLVEDKDTIVNMRNVKDSVEINRISIAQEITDGAFEHILKTITPNMTENDVAIELEYYMRKHGAEDKSFDTIAVSGKKSSLPHGVPGNVRLQKGFLTMDFGALYEGYHADMTRTICIGKADNEMKKVYNTVLKAQLEVIDMLKAGVPCFAADKVARDIIEIEYPNSFKHSLGHGVGLEIHERVIMSKYSKKGDTLALGNVVSVEPGIYLDGKYGVRIEDIVLIREQDVLNFTKGTKELIEIY